MVVDPAASYVSDAALLTYVSMRLFLWLCRSWAYLFLSVVEAICRLRSIEHCTRYFSAFFKLLLAGAPPRLGTPTPSLSQFRCCMLHHTHTSLVPPPAVICCCNLQATCTFTPSINERSRRLAETQEARQMLLDFARAGADSDGEAEGGGDGGGGGRAAGERAAARAPSKVMAKAQQLYDEHAVNEHRKEQRRKVCLQ